MLGFSVGKYLPEYWTEQANLYSQKLIPMLDWFMSYNNPQSDKMVEAFDQIVNKYTSTPSLPFKGLQNFVREMGYGYIIDFYGDDETSLRKLVSFLVLVHLMKGSRKGLELALDILGISGTIVEWWEETPVGTVDTFTLRIDSTTLTGNEDPLTYQKFETFVKNYVYPEVAFEIVYDADFGLNITIDVQGMMREEYQEVQFISQSSRILLEDNIELEVVDIIGSEFYVGEDYTNDFPAGDTFKAYYGTGVLDFDTFTVQVSSYLSGDNTTQIQVVETIPNSVVYNYLQNSVGQRVYDISSQQVISGDYDYIEVDGEYNTEFDYYDKINLYYTVSDYLTYNVHSAEYINSTNKTRIFIIEDLDDGNTYLTLEKADNEYYILTEDSETINQLLIF